MSIDGLITSYGYLAVFGLVAIESLGVPLPGETALIAAGTYAGTTHRLSPWLIFVVASAAAIVGDNIGFWIGDKGGYRLAYRYGRRVRLDERKLKIARYLFDRHGPKVVFFGRFVSVLRTYAAFLAGTTRMAWWRFFGYNAAFRYPLRGGSQVLPDALAAALWIAAGRGRKPTYTSQQHARILAEVQREPDREKDQTATWSLLLLRGALRKQALPHIARETIRQVLHEAGYRYQRTRTWVRTGYALRVRKSGTVTTYDPETPEKKD